MAEWPSPLNFCKAIQATGFKGAELALVDLCQFASVSAFADTFTRDGSQIDILVYNAAVAVAKYSATGDGWEESWVFSACW
jgi:retinol dehydrogenase-12